MSETEKTIRLSNVRKELQNVPPDRMISFLTEKGFVMDSNPNQKISEDMRALLLKEFESDKEEKEESKRVTSAQKAKKETALQEKEVVKTELKKVTEPEEPVAKPIAAVVAEKEEIVEEKPEKKKSGPKVVGKVDLASLNSKTKPAKKTKKQAEEEEKEKVKASKAAKKEKVEKAEEPTAIEKGKGVEKIAEVQKPEIKEKTTEEPVVAPKKEIDFLETKVQKLGGPTIVGRIELPVREERKKPVASSGTYDAEKDKNKKKRKRIRKPSVDPKTVTAGTQTAGSPGDKPREFRPGINPNYKGKKGREPKAELTPDEIQAQIKETLARLSGHGKSTKSKYNREKRDAAREKSQEVADQQEADKKIIKVTEFVSANQLAQMMNVQVNEIISSCMSLGIFVSINQRLDAETLAIVAEEFGYQVEFVSVEVQEAIKEEEDTAESLLPRSPIVTVMGHVDHGKTSLLDYIRKANVIAGEAGGITQHIGAYNVTLENGKKITFLDTPGHEAFTAMRARGAQVTDIAIIVIAADDSVMPQTIEAINHAQAAGVPLVFAINKIDKPGAEPDKIRTALANMNILVEEWGGKYQCQEISAKQGKNIDTLLEKVLLEAEMLDLKANPNKNALGTVIESSLDKGRGYVTTILVEAGTMNVGDIVLAGCYSGKVKALHNERGTSTKEAGPSMPVLLLGLNGAPQAGDKFHVMNDEREAREIATKRLQLQREQGIRTQKHITLDEIGRRLAIGDFKELNVIVKGDVDGSIEALADSLLKLSTDKIKVNIIHKSVGQITESDVLLASASNAIIIGFQVRPSANARKLAEQEQIDIRLYSIIYDAINEIKAAMEGMLAPEFEEKIVCNIEIREVFKITKVGTIAGCMVLDGKVTRQTKVRIIRDGIVVHAGTLASLKRLKDDVKEVTTGYECGLNIANFNDIKAGDMIEGYEEVEIKPKL
ncbi:MAG: translation initiation factor IF-2 [Bacteroidia bacterium]